MKKIGFVIPWFAEKIPGGAEMALRGLTFHMHRAGIDLEILTTCVEQFASDWSVNYYEAGVEVINGVLVRRFPVCKRDTKAFDSINRKLVKQIKVSFEEEEIFLREMVNSPALYEFIKEHLDEYSVFAFTPYMFGTTYYGIQECMKKSVLIPCLHNESYAHFRHFKDVFSRVCGMAFLSRSEYVLAHWLYDLHSVNARTLGTGVDTGLKGDGRRFREKYNIMSPYLIYAGRKDSGKNVDILLKYFEIYKSRHRTDLKLVLIGGGKINISDEIKNEVYDLGYVPIQDKYDAYAAAEFLCNPSRFESFSLVLMESWLCHRPVVVFRGCPVMYDFALESNGGLGFENYWEFEGCADYLLVHRSEADIMGENGRNYVLANFAWDVIVKKYMDFFEECCNKEN